MSFLASPLDETHRISSRVFEKTEYNDAGNFKSWDINSAALSRGLFLQRLAFNFFPNTQQVAAKYFANILFAVTAFQ